MNNIVLFGFMGTGKTAVAEAVAETLSREYVSIDALIEKGEGASISDIFLVKGEPYFRAVEKEIVKEVSSLNDKVIDTGGGVILDEENVDNLKAGGVTICLWASPHAIYERTKSFGHRPLLNVDDPEGKIKELLDHRKPFYEKAEYHIDTTDLKIGDVVLKVKDILNESH